MERRFVIFVSASTLFMAAVLLMEGPALTTQLGLGLATAGFVWFFVRRTELEPRYVITAIIVATTGEIVLSLGWGLYDYQYAIIPFYVPPGHGLFYALAAVSARQEMLRRNGPTITRAVMIAGSIIAMVSLIGFRDTWGFLWWIGALLLIRKSKNQLMLSTCFIYTIFLEWAGTAIGNWRWMPDVPGVGLTSANPPAGVGILYILLDLITMAICTALASARTQGELAAEYAEG